MPKDSAPSSTPIDTPDSGVTRSPSPHPPPPPPTQKAAPTHPSLLRYLPARLHIITPSSPSSSSKLLTILDPLASRSFISPSTLATHFPTSVPRILNPSSLFSTKSTSENSVKKVNMYVHLPLVFVDQQGEKVERWTDVIVREAEGWDSPMRVLLGMDFWGQQGVGVVWLGTGKDRRGDGFEGLVFWHEEGEGGEEIRERRVEFERRVD